MNIFKNLSYTILIIIFILFAYHNIKYEFDAYDNIDGRYYYTAFCDNGWFYYPIRNFLNGYGMNVKSYKTFMGGSHVLGSHGYFILYLFIPLVWIFSSINQIKYNLD